MSNCHFYYWNNNLKFFHQISLCSQTTTPGMEAQRDLLHPAAQRPNLMHEAILFALFFSSCQTTGQKTPTRLHRVVNCKYDVTSFHHCFRNGLNSFNWFCSSNPRMYLVTCEAKKSKSGEWSQKLQRHWWQSMQNSLQAICTNLYQISIHLWDPSGIWLPSPNKDSLSKNVLTIPEVDYSTSNPDV